MAKSASAATKKAAKKTPVVELEEAPQPNLAEVQEKAEALWTQIENTSDRGERAKLIKEYNVAAKLANELAGNPNNAIIKSLGEAPKYKAPEQEDEDFPFEVEGDEVEEDAGKKKGAVKVPAEIKVGDTIDAVFAGGKVTGEVTAIDGDRIKMLEADGTKYAIERQWILEPGETATQRIHRLEAASGKQRKQATTTTTEPRAPKKPRNVDRPPSDPGKLEKMTLTKEIKAILDKEVSGADKIREVYDLVTGWDGKKAKHPEKFDVEDFVKMSGIARSRVKGCIDKFRK